MIDRLNGEEKLLEQPLYVLMLGPSLSERGGMGSVETLILGTVTDQLQIRHISSWNEELGRNPRLRMLQVFLKALTLFLQQLLTQKVDLVHIHMAERGSVFRKSVFVFIAWSLHKPVILHAHGSEFHLFYNDLPSTLKKSVNWALQRCTYLIALSESWRDFYVNHCNLKAEQVVVLRNPVIVPASVPLRIDSQEIKFLFLGKINQRKGISELLQAFAQLSTRHQSTLKLILAGSGEIKQARCQAQNLHIEHRIIFTGWVDTKTRNQLLSEADIFVLPSYNEGLPMALLEAMSWGLPAITTPVGGIPEMIIDQKTGLLVEPGNIEQLKTAMQSLIDDSALRLNIGSAAREKVAPLSIDRYIFSLLNLYLTATGASQQSFFEYEPFKEGGVQKQEIASEELNLNQSSTKMTEETKEISKTL